MPLLYILRAWPITKRSRFAALNQHALRDQGISFHLHGVCAEGSMGLSCSHPIDSRINALVAPLLSWNNAHDVTRRFFNRFSVDLPAHR